MTSTLASLRTLLGDRFTDDEIERQLYAEDMAPVPALLVRPFFRTIPDAVLRPATAEQVSAILSEAAHQRFPITPRAAATTSLFNTVPLRGGLVLDLNDLEMDEGNGLLALDEGQGRARVAAAARWLDLDQALQERGFAVRSYPSSAVAATVGGWVSTQGEGLGSLRYGPLAGQLIAARAVLPSGAVRTLTPDSDPPLGWFVAAEGTLGVLTEVELQVRHRPDAEAHHLLTFEEVGELQSGALTLARAEPQPYTLLFTDPGYLRLLQAAGFPPRTIQPTLLASFQGPRAEVEKGRQLLRGVGGKELDESAALEEWAARLYHLRAKRAGPSLLAAEVRLPLEGLAGYMTEVAALARQSRTPIGSYGVVVSPHEAIVTSVYPADERQSLRYLLALGLTARLHRLAARRGGWPYGVGLWNTPYLRRLFSPQRLAELRAIKSRLDPHGLMNPGKLYAAPFPLWPPVFWLATRALAIGHSYQRSAVSYQLLADD